MAMQKDLLSSTIAESDTEDVAAVEASDSSSTILTLQSNNCPCDGNNAASLGQRFKGVIQQQNGNWGAQIYANHQRIWLGTFKSDEEAAMAYDSAAIKLRSGDPRRNFPMSQKPQEESEFQSSHSTEAVLEMIKDGSYRDKLSEYISAKSSDGPENGPGCPSVFLISNPDGLVIRLLFQKVLTPSDVGKLNRLVIPKKNAIKFFPRICPWNGESVPAGEDYGIQQVFYDGSMKSWNFRYCYWSSSHSFVFTKGWNHFVKEKKLRSGDVVVFNECSCHDHDGREEKKFYMINVAKRVDGNMDVQMTAKCSDYDDATDGDRDGSPDVKDEKQQVFKLFGVEIVQKSP